MISSEADQVLSEQLEPGERILWSGLPRTGLRLIKSDAYVIPVSVGFGLFQLYLWRTFDSSNDFSFLWLMALVMAYVLVGRFFVDSWQRKRTRYAVSNQRVLMMTNFLRVRSWSVRLEDSGEMAVDENPDGSGSIVFGPFTPSDLGVQGMRWPGNWAAKRPASLDSIENVRRVAEIIAQAGRDSITSEA